MAPLELFHEVLMSNTRIKGPVRLSRYLTVGAADAIEDKTYLINCFLDNGSASILQDLSDPRCVALGRTGVGKTALLEVINSDQERIINLDPSMLAISYLANNELIRFFAESGVNMDLFYRLLWRHVLIVEIIKAHYNIINEQSRDSFTKRIWEMMTVSKAKKEALNYVLNWGRSFWEAPDYRVKEITKNFETDLKESMGATVKEKITGSGFDLSHASTEKLSVEEKAEIVRVGQQVVNSVQIQRMSEVISLLDQDILTDQQKSYFITIDKLDEDWIEDNLRYQMLQALLETTRDINNKLRQVKIIIALRDDLVQRTFRFTRNPGYQSEKYKSLYLNLHWTRKEIEEMLDLRVAALIKKQFTSSPMVLRDILPDSTSKIDYVEYFIDRTLLRPRDAIMFLNECIRQSEGKRRVSKDALTSAEVVYSGNRLDALSDEWAADYPHLRDYAMVLRQLPRNFRIFEVKERIESRCVDLFTRSKLKESDLLYREIMEAYAKNEYNSSHNLIYVLFKTGIIGIKNFNHNDVKWSFQGSEVIEGDITDESYIVIHPAFYKALGI